MDDSSKLERLEEELYGRDSGEIEKRLRRRMVVPDTLRRSRTTWIGAGEPKKPGQEIARRSLRWALFGGGILFLAGLVLFFFMYLSRKGTEAEIVIHDRGPVEAGELVTIPIVVRNVSGTVLNNVELTVHLPQSAHRVAGEDELGRPASARYTTTIGKLGRREEYTEEVRARFFGREGEEQIIGATIIYQPEGLRARFSSTMERAIRIDRVPLTLSWELPALVAKGQTVEAKVRYSSSASRPFQETTLRLEYPAGFSFESAVPKPDIGDALWTIGMLKPGDSGEITVRGTVVDGEGDIKVFTAGLGVFDALSKEWMPYVESGVETRLAITPLSISASLDGLREKTIIPGETLLFLIRYRNNTEATIQNATIRAALDGRIVDLSTLNIGGGGAFDAVSGSVVWSPGGTPELRQLLPGEEGTLRLQVRTRSQPQVRSGEDTNIRVTLTTSIDATGIPEELAGVDVRSSDVVQFKVRTIVFFNGRAVFRASPIPNDGPVPPRVGQKTSYVIVWEVRNFTNDVENVSVAASLPPTVSWEGKISPSDRRITYDPARGEIRWAIGTLKAGVGVIAPALTAAFQVSVIPSEADIGSAVTLVHEASLTGHDRFVDEDRKEELRALTTELRDDVPANQNEWRVIR